ncbi:MAG: UDP-N-acetylmuramoyl-L-alanyl-D-glutamate--2,6-diaminopimelate ligase, partial [Ruminococcus sp.]|nr:UDP-N-acetylmuramoyl-L-alanyl-D-glutamate--2,6-diaminopimelate ligase [Ruminococcus sp.]
MKLKDLLKTIDYEIIKGNLEKDISDIVYDSRKITSNSMFVCLKGYNSDGHSYAGEAVEKGASAILICDDIEIQSEDVAIIKVKDTRESLAYISAEFFSNPAKELTTIAITGTNGKTTTVAMIKRILE